MGLIYHDVERLRQAHLAGCSFRRVLMVAHQQLFLHPAELDALRRAYRDRAGRDCPISVPLAGYRFGEYADRFLKEFLDVEHIDILDYSSYEGATLVHDMNTPIPPEYEGCFDVVIEAGSLEHIFNFPIAIQNLLLMAKVGGTIFLTTVANNFCGHGFYQFSPELIYRIFCPDNGFEKPEVLFLEADFPWVELTPIRATYAVIDPREVGGRVGLQSSRPVLMTIKSRKVSDLRPFVTNPQQSDYAVAWKTGPAETQPARARSLKSSILRSLPDRWRKEIEGHRNKWQYSFSNRRFYKKL